MTSPCPVLTEGAPCQSRRPHLGSRSPPRDSAYLSPFVPHFLTALKCTAPDHSPHVLPSAPSSRTLRLSPRVWGLRLPTPFPPHSPAQYSTTKRSSMQRCLECLSRRWYYLQRLHAVPGASRGLKDTIQTKIVWHCLFLHIPRERTNLVITVFAPQIRDSPFCVHGG